VQLISIILAIATVPLVANATTVTVTGEIVSAEGYWEEGGFTGPYYVDGDFIVDYWGFSTTGGLASFSIFADGYTLPDSSEATYLDSHIMLFKSDETDGLGTMVAENNDKKHCSGFGSCDDSWNDSFLEATLLAGAYTLAVSTGFLSEDEARNGKNPQDELLGNTVGGYELTMTYENELAAVPVPPAIYLMGSSLLGLLGLKKRKNQA